MNHQDTKAPRQHPGEEQLLWYYYRESAETEAIAEHLAGCEACRAAYANLERTMRAVDAAPVPEPPQNYEAHLWSTLQPRLGGGSYAGIGRLLGGISSAVLWRRTAFAASMAALIIAAFLLGRFWPRPQSIAGQPIPEQVRERILLVAVGDHLDRSQMVLIELANADPKQQLDVSSERQWAADLVNDNRLYRQAAARSGDPAVAAVLDELERLLVEIAHSPSTLSGNELEQIQQRIESGDMLFKLRVVGSRVRQEENAAVPQQSSRGKL